MSDSTNKTERPRFPKRAVITGGMPYGDKKLHFGHVYGNFLHADIYARFLRDRIGADNVIFVSGTDCYGAGPEVKYEAAVQNGFTGTIKDFVRENYDSHKQELKDCGISLNFYGASALGEAADLHSSLSAWLFETLYDNGYLRVNEVKQFFDEETNSVLNGRQVEGRCPIAGCKSEKGYADECALGHQYSPEELIAPVAVTTGKTPSLRTVKNWYFDLESFSDSLKQRVTYLKEEGISRRFMLSTIEDFLKDPTILIKTEDFNSLNKAREEMAAHEANINEGNKSATLIFRALKDREAACEVLRKHNIRFRTGTTLVPFRLTGDVKWGIPVPVKEGIGEQTFWVWPESLWAPFSFVEAYLKSISKQNENSCGVWDKYLKPRDENVETGWEHWWLDPDTCMYQFIGEDNIYFYAVAEMGLLMALNKIMDREPNTALPTTIPNRHVFYGKRKAASSGALRAPTVSELLEHYTHEQLRMHFAHMTLQNDSGNFSPKAYMEKNNNEKKNAFDVTLAEGNILTNVYNRLIRSCFYSLQKYYEGKLPEINVSEETKNISDTLINEYEWAMYRFEFSRVIDLLDAYLRESNKKWDAQTKAASAQEKSGDEISAVSMRSQALIDAFHAVRVAATLLHPFAPEGTETVRKFLQFDERIWDWKYIYESLRFFMKEDHTFLFLEPRVDFFAKHSSQLSSANCT